MSEYTYFAFVSYSHKDEKWAKWIQTALESYRLPAAVRKEAGKALPPRIHPVFRDATDLSVGKLVDNLRQELEQSRFLIVVCSPHSARPNEQGKHWVNEEVERFCELGRADKVIPVIVGGTKETAYCPKLAEEDILGLDATKQPRERILNDLVAKILGLRPDELWRREERRRRVRRRRRIWGAVLLAALLAVGGYMVWDATRTVVNHYADYVDSFGLPEGIFPLKKSELAHRHHHYRFEYKGVQSADCPHADSADWSIWNALGLRRRLVRVVQANSRGYPCNGNNSRFTEAPQIQSFEYQGGQLREIREGRFNGVGCEPHLVKRILFSDERGVVNGLARFFSTESLLSMDYAESSQIWDPAKGTMSAKTQIVQHLLRRDAKGRVQQTIYLNPFGQSVPDGDGFSGFTSEQDDLGRPTAHWFLGCDGTAYVKRANKKGIAGLICEYAGPHFRRITWVDATGHPVLGPDNWIILERHFDVSDNSTGGRFFDDLGREMVCAAGYSSWQIENDGAGNAVKTTFSEQTGPRHCARTGMQNGVASTTSAAIPSRRHIMGWTGNRHCVAMGAPRCVMNMTSEGM